MTMLQETGVLILTYNEAPNIGRTLNALRAFPEVVVLDSGSTDETIAIVRRYPNCRLVTRRFDNHAAQWTFGLTGTGLRQPWLLALDADYVLSPELVREIARLQPAEGVAGYRIGFRYCVFGRPLSGTLYPPVIALYRRERAQYVQEGHTQRVLVEGRVEQLAGRIDHDDRKALDRWITSQQRYAALEADHLLASPKGQLRRIDRIRRLGWAAPILVFFYTLLVKRCILDGWPGWCYVLQRTLAETMIALTLLDRRLRGGHAPSVEGTADALPAPLPGPGLETADRR
jgi:glycosyltransferase involved in cell wall biosynthesis